ncbi:MAG: hypothetical protein IIY05_02500 [Alistipes sp.]|nr:hypothetical protein [Alistipes sp.]
MLNKSAKILSWVLHPFVVPIYVMLILLFTNTVHSYYALRVKVYLLWSVALYTLVLPGLTLALLKRLQELRRVRINKRQFIVIALLVGAVCYVLCAMTMMRAPSLALFRKMAVAGMTCYLFCLISMLFSRVSLHLTAMGAVVALFVLLNILGELSLFGELLVAILLSGMLASARLYMGRNRSRQVLAGFVGGFCCCAIAMMWL